MYLVDISEHIFIILYFCMFLIRVVRCENVCESCPKILPYLKPKRSEFVSIRHILDTLGGFGTELWWFEVWKFEAWRRSGTVRVVRAPWVLFFFFFGR